MENNIEVKRARVQAQLDLVIKVIEQENSVFISIASLAVALIIILSLNKDLIFFSSIESKVLLTLFLSLIVISMTTHLYSLHMAKDNSVKIIDGILGKKTMDLIDLSPFNKILAYIPKLVTGIFFVSIGYIIYVIWR